MATLQMSVIGGLQPDTSGDIYPSFLSIELTLGNLSPGRVPCIVMDYPTGADIGGELAFTVPQNYAGSPVLVIRGVLDGTSTDTIAFGCQQIARDDNETADIAYDAEDLANTDLNISGHADEDVFEETITITPAAAWTTGDLVFLWFFRDNSVDDTTINFLLTDLLIQYSDT
jgi:hypothetical protein